jgi:hypothetical protein
MTGFVGGPFPEMTFGLSFGDLAGLLHFGPLGDCHFLKKLCLIFECFSRSVEGEAPGGVADELH